MAKDNLLQSVLNLLRKPKVIFSGGLSKTHNDNNIEYAGELHNFEIVNGVAVKRRGSVLLNRGDDTPVRYLWLDNISIGATEFIIGIDNERRMVAHLPKPNNQQRYFVCKSQIKRGQRVSFDRGDWFYGFTIGNRYTILNEFGDAYTILLDGIFKIAPYSTSDVYYPDNEYSRSWSVDSDALLYLDVRDATNRELKDFFAYATPQHDSIPVSGEVRACYINEMGVYSKLSDPLLITEKMNYVFSLERLTRLNFAQVQHITYDSSHLKRIVSEQRLDITVKRFVDGIQPIQLYFGEKILQMLVPSDDVFSSIYGDRSWASGEFSPSYTVKKVFEKYLTTDEISTPTISTNYVPIIKQPRKYADDAPGAFMAVMAPDLDVNAPTNFLNAVVSMMSTSSDNLPFIRCRAIGYVDIDNAGTTATDMTTTDIVHFDRAIECVAVVSKGQTYSSSEVLNTIKLLDSGSGLGKHAYIDFTTTPATHAGDELWEWIIENIIPVNGDNDVFAYGSEIKTDALDNSVFGFAIIFEFYFDSSGDFVPAYPVIDDISVNSNPIKHIGYDCWQDTAIEYDLDDSIILTDYRSLFSKTIDDDVYFPDSRFTDHRFAIWNDDYIISQSQLAMVDDDDIVYDVLDANYDSKKLTSAGSANKRVVSQTPSRYDVELKPMSLTKPVYQTLRRVGHKYNPFQEVLHDVVDVAVNNDLLATVQGGRVWIGSSLTLLLEKQQEFVGDVRFVESFRDGFAVFTNRGVWYISREGKVQEVRNYLADMSDFVATTSNGRGGDCYALTELGTVVAVRSREVSTGVWQNEIVSISDNINTVHFSDSTIMRVVNNALYVADEGKLYRYNGTWSAVYDFGDKLIDKITSLHGEVVLSFYDYRNGETVDVSQFDDEGM